MRTLSAGLAAALSCLVFSASVQALPERPSVSAADALARMRAASGRPLFEQSIPKDAYTMVQALGDTVIVADGGVGTPSQRASTFLALYGAAIGITDPQAQFSLARISSDTKGQVHVHLDQVKDGLPVYGARIIVHMNGAGITGFNGVFVPGVPDISVVVPRELGSLRAIALADRGKAHAGADLEVTSGRWVVYPEGLLRGALAGSHLAYEAVVASTGGKALRERVIVDAVTGRVLDTINDLHTFLNREVYTPDKKAPPTYDESATSVATPAGPADPALHDDFGPHSGSTSARATRNAQDNLWIFDGGTYKVYANMFGRKGYDACDNGGPCQPDKAAPDWSPTRGDIAGTGSVVGQVQKTVYLVNQQCPNAYWDGDATNYCPGFDGDDVVSHEWSHAYTQYMHGLIYAYQSGALNEGWSDIFGESYDLMNVQEGPLGQNLTEGEYYENGGSRWVVGEDLSEQVATLLLRDMWKPDDFPAANPGNTKSPNYSCGSGDGGGVHANSSVPNHAFAILVDGTKDQGPAGTTGTARDSYGGQSFMPGIGMTKALQIYFYAENNYQTPTTDFPQHAAALRMSCQQLKGQAINDVTGAIYHSTKFGDTITQADCDKLNQAMLAVQMDLGSPCPYIPVLKQDAPAQCDGAADFFKEGWESGGTGWTKTSTGRFQEWNDSTRSLRDWRLKSGSLPEDHPGTVAFADNIPVGEPGGGTCQPGGDYSGEFTYDSPIFTVPAGASNTELRFEHYVNTEAGADGGLLFININNGGFKVVSQANYKYNPPNRTLLGAADTSNNPEGDQYAWTGADINPPSGAPPSRWGTTVVNLAALAKAGDKVQLRFTFAQEGCNGTDGWYVDNIHAFSCPTLTAPVLSVANYENPDTDGAYTLNWTRPGNSTGPDLLQSSETSCAPLLNDPASSLAAWTAAGAAPGPTWTTSSTKGGHAGNSTFFAQPASDEVGGTALLTLTAPLAIPASGTTTMSFKQWYYNENDDRGYIEVSTNNGTTWSKIYTQDKDMGALPDEAANSFANDDLTTTTLDLTQFAGKTIRLRFEFTQGDLDYFFFVAYGWFLDDILITNDNWGDVATLADNTLAFTSQVDGSKCYRVRTTYPVGAATAASLFSNVVNVKVKVSGTGNTNLAPIANAGPDQAVAGGSNVQLDGSLSTDPNSDPLTYTWTQTGGTPVTLVDATTDKPSFTAPAAGSGPVDFELTVKDPAGLSSTDSVRITINPAEPPPPPAATGIGATRVGGALPPAALLVLAAAALARRRRR